MVICKDLSKKKRVNSHGGRFSAFLYYKLEFTIDFTFLTFWFFIVLLLFT